MGLPELMVVHISVVARWLDWTLPDRCLPWIRKNLICDCWFKKISIKYHYQNRKPMTVTIRPRSQSDYKQPIKKKIYGDYLYTLVDFVHKIHFTGSWEGARYEHTEHTRKCSPCRCLGSNLGSPIHVKTLCLMYHVFNNKKIKINKYYYLKDFLEKILSSRLLSKKLKFKT